MSYSDPNRILVPFTVHTWSGGETYAYYGPKGKAAALWDYGIYGVTTAVTTTATAAIGDGSDADKYGEEFSVVALDNTGISVRSTYEEWDTTNLATYIIAAGKVIAKNTKITYTATAGGAGVATPFMIIDFDR